MAVKKKYTNPLQVVATPEQRARIMKIAEDDEVSQAAVIRDMIDMALDAREKKSKTRKRG